MNKLITTSVVRGSNQQNSQGGVLILDLEKQDARQVLSWNDLDIDWGSRGEERGFRGIAIDGETIYFVSGDELFAYSSDFRLLGSWRNIYLNKASELSIFERTLYIVSSGFDSILGFELDEKKFHWALHVDLDRFDYTGSVYDPMGDKGPLLLHKLHLNNVHTNENGMYISGTRTGGMLHFNGESIYVSVTLPDGVNNAQPFRDGVLFHDSEAEALRYASRTGEEDRAVMLPKYDLLELEHKGVDESGVAAQGFGRGLCVINDRIVAAGSSPSTVSIVDLRDSKTLLSVNLSKDVRTAIHGLAIWPF